MKFTCRYDQRRVRVVWLVLGHRPQYGCDPFLEQGPFAPELGVLKRRNDEVDIPLVSSTIPVVVARQFRTRRMTAD